MEIAQTMLAQAMAAAPVEACEETYGVFPCSSSFWGSIFLVCTYGYLLLQGANLISDGSELLLAVSHFLPHTSSASIIVYLVWCIAYFHC